MPKNIEKRVGKQRILPELVIYGGATYAGKRYQPMGMTHKVIAPPGFTQET